MEKLQKAVKLSEERYCGVSAVYKKIIKLTSEIRVLEL
jgi:putative redox protein